MNRRSVMPDVTSEEQRELELATVIAALTDQLCRGSEPSLEQTVTDHPRLESEIRELWGAIMLTEGLAAGSSIRTGAADQAPTPTHTAGSATPGTAYPTRTAAVGSVATPLSFPEKFGDYELIEELGRGGMGVVYLARQISLNRVVAVKMLIQGGMASEADQQRFRAEAESAARLDHPHIIPVYEVGDLDGRPYFSMKYIEGTTLARRLATGPMNTRHAAELLAPICEAIHYAHSRGVLHRDLKPSNILIDAAGKPHVMDFGLAKRIEDGAVITRTGAILGTPSYMAPEQAAGSRGELGPASDVYSLGAILYEMLTGRPVFQAATPVDTVLMVLEQDPLPPRLLNAKADRDLEMVALKCLQKPITLRYATAGELAGDLDAYLAGEVVSARTGGFTQVIARLFRETHHAPVLENWGLLWMWHSFVLLVLCVLTNIFAWLKLTSPEPYLALWSVGLAVWAAAVWAMRRRSGPVTFVERQVAHVWAAGMLASSLLFVIEILLGLPVLTLSPVLGLISGMVFLVKAGILSGLFYFQAAALFLTAGVMAILPGAGEGVTANHVGPTDVGLTLFGIVSAACFFFPGLKYYRQLHRSGSNVAMFDIITTE